MTDSLDSLYRPDGSTEPDPQFRSALMARLERSLAQQQTLGAAPVAVDDFSRSDTDEIAVRDGPNVPPLGSLDDCIVVVNNSSRLGQNKRFSKSVLAVAACVALIAIGGVLVSRDRWAPNATDDTHDVNQADALRLAQRALITTDALGIQWTSGNSWGESGLPLQAEATIAARPDCALLRTVGLFPPTTKSATAHQFVPGNNYLFQEVLVFATPEDAARAMDVADGAAFPECWFELYDRLTPMTLTGSTSTSEAWTPPHVYGPLEPFEIPPHGDRQILIGQHTTISRSSSSMERYFINAFVQVGRTISWVNPRFVVPNDTTTALPGFRAVGVNEAITAATSALNSAVGH